MLGPIQRRSAAPIRVAKLAGSTPIQNARSTCADHGSEASHPAASATRHSTGTASGQPSTSVIRQAPESCSCSGMWCSQGIAHSQGVITSAASRGETRPVCCSRRQGCMASAASKASASSSRVADSSIRPIASQRRQVCRGGQAACVSVAVSAGLHSEPPQPWMGPAGSCSGRAMVPVAGS